MLVLVVAVVVLGVTDLASSSAAAQSAASQFSYDEGANVARDEGPSLRTGTVSGLDARNEAAATGMVPTGLLRDSSALAGGVVAPSGLVKPWRNGAGELTNGSYTVFGARQAKHTTGNLSDGASQFFYRVDDEALTLDAAAYADQMGLWVDNKAKVYVDELIGVTGDGTPTHWINLYRRDPGGQLAPYVHGSPGNPP